MRKNYLSTNTLFHYTNCIDSLVNILKNDFYPNFSLEDSIELQPGKTVFNRTREAPPMVCFCDIPLSQISTHIRLYGSYCIGLKKEWGIKKGINPVMYFHKHSDYSKDTYFMFSRLYEEAKMLRKIRRLTKSEKAKDDMDRLAIKFFHFLTHNFAHLGDYLIRLSFQSKPYEGRLWRKGKFINNIRFYDEKEWRFVPEIPTLVKNRIPFSLNEKQFHDKKIRKKHTDVLKKCSKLSFKPKDIKYIIVKSDYEILYMAKKIEEIKSKFSKNDKMLLKSKIIPIRQVLEDF